MLGGIAAAGADRILFTQRDGEALILDVESREIVGYRTPHPFCPERVEVSACGIGPDQAIVMADSLHSRVRVFAAPGAPRLMGPGRLIGTPPGRPGSPSPLESLEMRQLRSGRGPCSTPPLFYIVLLRQVRPGSWACHCSESWASPGAISRWRKAKSSG